jgi:hypothetical protein
VHLRLDREVVEFLKARRQGPHHPHAGRPARLCRRPETPGRGLIVGQRAVRDQAPGRCIGALSQPPKPITSDQDLDQTRRTNLLSLPS